MVDEVDDADELRMTSWLNLARPFMAVASDLLAFLTTFVGVCCCCCAS